jgi:putative membrane protein
MHKSVVIAALSGAILFAVAASAADQAAKPTDPQIAHIAYTAGKIDIEAAQQALNKSKNKDVHAFAQRMIGDHTGNKRPGTGAGGKTPMLLRKTIPPAKI